MTVLLHSLGRKEEIYYGHWSIISKLLKAKAKEYVKSDIQLLRKVSLKLRLKYCPYNNLLYLQLPGTSTVTITNTTTYMVQ